MAIDREKLLKVYETPVTYDTPEDDEVFQTKLEEYLERIESTLADWKARLEEEEKAHE